MTITGVPAPGLVLAAAGKEAADELARALSAATGRKVLAADLEVTSLRAGDLAGRLAGPAAAFCLEMGGICAGRAALVMGARVSAGLVGLLRGLEGEALESRLSSEPSDLDLEDLGGTVGGALAGLAEKLGTALGAAPRLLLGDALVVPADRAEELLGLLGPGPHPGAVFRLEIEGLVFAAAALIFPASFSEAPAAAPGAGTEVLAAAAPGPVSEVVVRLHPNMQRILRLGMTVSVIVAEKEMPVESIVKLSPGTIVEFSKSAAEDLELRVNGHRIGLGEVVTIGDRFGIQLRTIEGLQQRIRKLGAARP